MTKRVFAALDLLPEQKQQLLAALAELRAALPDGWLRWLPPESLHLTLKFFGEVAPGQVADIQAGLARAAKDFGPVTAEIASLGIFPDPRRPQVLWVGLDGDLKGLKALQSAVEAEASALGFDPEMRPFKPHLTVARVNNDLEPENIIELMAALKARRNDRFGAFRADHLTLMQSDLRPAGSVYTPLFETPLTQAAPAPAPAGAAPAAAAAKTPAGAKRQRGPADSIDLARSIVDALEDKKADDIVLLDLRGQSIVTDFFVICTGSSDRQLHALADAVADAGRKQHRLKAPKVEGQPEGGWVLVDYGAVIVHCFSSRQRDRYKLEELWQDGKIILRIQ